METLIYHFPEKQGRFIGHCFGSSRSRNLIVIILVVLINYSLDCVVASEYSSTVLPMMDEYAEEK